MGKAVGGLVGGLTGGLFGPEANAGQAEMDSAQANLAEATRLFRELDIPNAEELAVQYVAPELVGMEDPLRREDTAFEDISLDPEVRQRQLDVLNTFQQLSEQGMTPEDMSIYRTLARQVEGDESARQASILQNMAQRGMEDSGAALAAQLQSSQGAANRMMEAADRQAAEAANMRRAALQNMGNMASNLRSQDYGEQQDLASARDVNRRFYEQNMANVQRANLNRRQAAEDARVGAINRTRESARDSIVNRFDMEARRADGIAGNLRNEANMRTGIAQNKASAPGPMSGLIGAGAGAAKMYKDFKTGGLASAKLDEMED